jgi:hypothetical protein
MLLVFGGGRKTHSEASECRGSSVLALRGGSRQKWTPTKFIKEKIFEKRSKSPMKHFLQLCLLGGATALVLPLLTAGCGGNAITSLENPAPVNAQQVYSTSSLVGSYALAHSGIDDNGQPFDGIGVLQLDGSGNVEGSVTDYYIGGVACKFKVTGTYSVTSAGSGTGSFTATPDTSGCADESGTVAIQAAQQGQAFQIAQTDGKALVTGTALKQ